MTQWLANCLWTAMQMVSIRAHDWFFDPQRAAAARMKNRVRWWAYKLQARATPDGRDDVRAKWFEIRFAFETSPDEANRRGDLDPQNRQMAADVMERARAGQGPAADRAKL